MDGGQEPGRILSDAHGMVVMKLCTTASSFL